MELLERNSTERGGIHRNYRVPFAFDSVTISRELAALKKPPEASLQGVIRSGETPCC